MKQIAEHPAEQIAFSFGRQRMRHSVILFLILLGIGVLTVVFVASKTSFGPFAVGFLIIGSLCCCLSALALIWAIRGFLGPSPAVIIGKDGLTDSASWLCAGHIPWTDIIDARYRIFHGSAGEIGIFVRDPSATIQKQPFAKRCAMRVNWRFSGTPIWIPADIATPSDGIIEVIRSRMKGA